MFSFWRRLVSFAGWIVAKIESVEVAFAGLSPRVVCGFVRGHVLFLFLFGRVVFWSLGCNLGENVVALPDEVLCFDCIALSVFSVSYLSLVFVDFVFL